MSSDPVGVGPFEEATKFIEAAVVGNFARELAHVPFAKGTGVVASFGKVFWEHLYIALDASVPG